MPQSKVCRIEYVVGCILDSGSVYGHRFDKLIKCCDEFGRWFNTGNAKHTSFNEGRNEDRDGFNFATRGGELKLCLRARGIEGEIKFCPFCGAEVEIILTKRVKLVGRTKGVFDGYNEIDVRIVAPPVATTQ